MQVGAGARAALGAAAVAVLAGTASGAPQASPNATTGGAAPAASLDFGDAPDGAPARYADKPRVRGSFPSRRRSGGPRHPAGGPRLGPRWSPEAESRQVDADADDGAQVNARSCALSTLNVLVDATRGDPTSPIYVNAWFDWNQDGDWADGGTRRCGPEWALQNSLIDSAQLGPDRVGVVTLRFRAGRVPSEFWWRVQVHRGSPVPHLGSGGQAQPTDGGETEDWLHSRVPPPRRPLISLRCSPGYGVIDHGRQHVMSFFLNAPAGARLSVRQAIWTVLGDRAGLDIRRRAVGPRAWMVTVKSTAKHVRDPWSQEMTVRLHVQALLNGQIQNYRVTCGLAVFHVRKVVPPIDPPEELKPVPRGGGGGNNVTPQSARCRARFARTGAVDIRCDGADAKTFSVDSGNGRRVTTYRTRGRTLSCRGISELRVLRCSTRLPNKGQIVGLDHAAQPPYDQGAGSVVIHVLAGGRGTEGTTIVLRQSWFMFSDGRLRCQQYVPTSGPCPPL